MDGLKPINGCALVELSETYANVATPEKQFATKTSGQVIKVSEKEIDNQYLVGKRVWFEEYKDGVQVNIDGKDYAFIKLEDIRGCSE